MVEKLGMLKVDEDKEKQTIIKTATGAVTDSETVTQCGKAFYPGPRALD